MNLIQITQLDILGIHETYRKLTIAFIMIFITYFIIRPLITKLVIGRNIMFLTYLVVSLLITIISVSIALIDNELNSIALGLQATALFGLCLVLLLLFQLIKRIITKNLKRRKS